MAKKLKTYETSLGFFDLAIAAPSMKAALEAWGADSNLFHQGMAKQSEDPDVIAATMAAPGVVLKRSVGSSGPFKEHAELPTDLAGDHGSRTSGRKSHGRRAQKPPRRGNDPAAERKAALDFEKEHNRHERERAKEEATREKERERRQHAIDKARGVLDAARRKHEEKAASIRAELEALEDKSQAEEARWRRRGRDWKMRCDGREVKQPLPGSNR
ncbi:cell envelope biogenesis protein TolA [Bradyrhizobium icense]|uniref:cell envelope biogenesis protein TolA n=1 Tax=Bradyrhizobium icense TaxID=1274631 RepID=UPI000A95080D